jgi:hypothetical protein
VSTPVRSDAALADYRASMRRSRAVYYAIVAVIVAALAVLTAVVWSRGEAAHATLHTVAAAPAALPLGTPSPTQQLVWRNSDHIALGVPQFGGTVLTFSRHTVQGRDVRTGKSTWTYTRTDRTVCTAAQLNGTAIAVYRDNGNCDELSAFDTGTGARRWTRTLDQDGLFLDGSPQYQVTPSTFVVASASVIYAIDPGTGYNRWTYDRYGCAIGRVVLGTGGALFNQTCSARVRCQGMKFCGRGPQLLLRDGMNGRDDKSKTNPDQIKWNRIGDPTTPVSADTVISSTGPRGSALFINAAGDGNHIHRVPLHPRTPAPGLTRASATDAAEIVWLSGVTYAVRADSHKADWLLPATAPPIVATAAEGDTASLSSARITVPTPTGVGIVDGTSGKLSDLALPTPPASDSLVFSAGTGFLVTGPAGIVAYR